MGEITIEAGPPNASTDPTTGLRSWYNGAAGTSSAITNTSTIADGRRGASPASAAVRMSGGTSSMTTEEFRAREAERQRQYRAADPERYQETNRRYAERHREEIRARDKAAYDADPQKRRDKSRRWRLANLEAIKERERSRRPAARAREHGLDWSTVERLYEAQAGACAICKNPAPLTGVGCLGIDHDHETGVRRGLLCTSCNTALHVIERHGNKWAEQALAYLASPTLGLLA